MPQRETVKHEGTQHQHASIPDQFAGHRIASPETQLFGGSCKCLAHRPENSEALARVELVNQPAPDPLEVVDLKVAP